MVLVLNSTSSFLAALPQLCNTALHIFSALCVVQHLVAAGDVVIRKGDETILTDKYGRRFRKAEIPSPAGADVREDVLDAWVPRIFCLVLFGEVR